MTRRKSTAQETPVHPMTRKARRDVQRMILTRMFTLAEQMGADPGSEDFLTRVEEFTALGYQLRLDVSPPDLDVQDALDARGLLTRRFEDDTPEPTPEEVAAIPERRR